MEFPIIELLGEENSTVWILEHFHRKGLKCPKCKRGVKQSRKFRRTQTSALDVQRCKHYGAVYNLYTGTVFQGSRWTPQQVVLLMRGICKGETTRELAAELALNYKTVLTMRHRVQANAELEQPNTALPDSHSETDEMFHAKRAGKKVNYTPILNIRHEKEPTNNADMEPMTMIVHLSWVRLGEKAGKYACASCTIPIAKRWKHMSITLRRKRQLAIPMNGNPIIISFENMQRYLQSNILS